MTDMLDRLRSIANLSDDEFQRSMTASDCRLSFAEMADEIASLRDDVEKLRAALTTARRDALEEAAKAVEPGVWQYEPRMVLTLKVAASVIRALKDEDKPKRRKLGHGIDGKSLGIIEPWCGQCVIDPRDGETWCVCGKPPVRLT
jgi:uncharacterized small protein (DUF1192 family)